MPFLWSYLIKFRNKCDPFVLPSSFHPLQILIISIAILRVNLLKIIEKEFRNIYLPTTTARSPLIVPGSDFCGSVAPISFRPYLITPSPSQTYQGAKKIMKETNGDFFSFHLLLQFVKATKEKKEYITLLTIASTGPELRKSQSPSKNGLSLRSW